MNVTYLKSDIKEFKHILNIADVHIRLKARHEEYVEIFNKLYVEIDKTPLETVITFSGDLFHNKSDMSAEGVYCASEFLRNLANRRPTIVISGNHDVNIMNSGKMGGIYPIINALNHPNLHYLKETGLYRLGDILFNCFSVFDERTPENYILHNKIPKN
jgi:predicted MPP superfamily phosphohydrolase